MPLTDMAELPFSEATFQELTSRAIEEDLGTGDITTRATVPPTTEAEGHLAVKEDGVVAGQAAVTHLLQTFNESLAVEWAQPDGSKVSAGTSIAQIRGPARSLLTVERLALNLMQRMSGIATATRHMVDAVEEYSAQILDTRKTAPGLRAFDKWAVRLGGGTNHRMGLYDMVLIKDNHITAAGGINEAIQAVHHHLNEHDLDRPIEVETTTPAQVAEVLSSEGVDRILLDNMVKLRDDGTVDTSLVEQCLNLIGDQIPAEVSGNVTLDTVHPIAQTGVAYISSGAITHSAGALDLSLNITLIP